MTEALGRVTLVTGKEEFLNERTVQDVRAAVKAVDAEAEVSETARRRPDARDARRARGTVAVLLDPVRGRAQAGGPAGGLGRRPPRVRRCAGRGRRARPGARRRRTWLRRAHQAAQAGRRDRAASRASSRPASSPASSPRRSARTAAGSTRRPPRRWCRRSGQDLRALAGGRGPARRTTRPASRSPTRSSSRYFGGRAEGKSFAIADAALLGRRQTVARGAALGACRRACRPTYVTSAFAGGHAVARHATSRRPRTSARQTWPARSACRRGSSRASRRRHRAGPTRAWPGRSGRSPRPTPTSRARRATPTTRSSGWSSRSPGLRARNAERPARASRAGRSRPASLRERRPSWRWPTCGWRPGSCG